MQHDGLSHNLLSVSQLVSWPGMKQCVFDKHSARLIAEDGSVIMQAPMENGLYRMSLTLPVEVANAVGVISVVGATVASDVQLMHEKLGHPSLGTMEALARSGAVIGLGGAESVSRNMKLSCGVCKENKATMKPFASSVPPAVKATAPLQRVHADLFGPVLHPSFADARFVLVIVDEFSNKVWTFPLKQKGDSANTIQVWAEQMKHQMGAMPKEFHTDNGGEFDNKTLLDFWQQHGVKHTFTPPYTPSTCPQCRR